MFYFSAAILAKITLHEVQKKSQSVEKLILIVYLPDESTYKQTNQMKKTRSNTFILENEKTWEPAGEGVVRQILGYDGQVMLVKVKFEQGATGAPHTHYHTQITYVASGKFEFTVNGKKQIVSAGDGVYIEPDAEHGCTCLEASILIDCFSPMRADFLK